MAKFAVGDGRRHGPPKALLTAVQLEEVKRLASVGKLDAGIAAGLGISLSLYKILKTERQSAEISEALERGRGLLHDSALAVKVRLMTDQNVDDRVRSEAASWILAALFNYRDRTPVQVGVAFGQQQGEPPQLKIVEEVVEPSRLQAMAVAIREEAFRDPMAMSADGTPDPPTVIRRRGQQPPHPAIHGDWSRTALTDAWGGGGGDDGKRSTTVHIRRDAPPDSDELARG